jgi:hypothetical protein
MIRYDLCLAWNWEYDLDFVRILEGACRRRRIFLYGATPQTVDAILGRLRSRELDILVLLDRASESDPLFVPLVEWSIAHGVYEINPHERAVRAMNKACMHLEFITGGIHTPHTIILSPWNEQHELGGIDLRPLGHRFIIKPAHGGGGEGVVHEASSLSQVMISRQEFPNDHYLLQAHIEPAELAGRPAWFRVIYCGGLVFPFWWNPKTHVYAPVTEEEVERHGLGMLRATALRIAGVCGLDIFSTEIALIPTGVFVAVDYVNHPIDLRLQSATPDGVPDAMVHRIAGRIAEIVRARLLLPESGNPPN